MPNASTSPGLVLVAIASSTDSQEALTAQLKEHSFIQFNTVFLELSDAVRQCQNDLPDVIVVELTHRELEAGLFIEAISLNPSKTCIIVALHHKMDHTIVLDAVRRGAKEFIQYPADHKSLDEALKKVHLKLVKKAQENALAALDKSADKGQLITVFSAKGGSGSSTVAINLAHEAHQLLKMDTKKGKSSICLFDLDQIFSNTAVMLNLKPTHCLGDLSQTPAADVDDALLQKITLHHESGLDLLVGTKSVLDDNGLISASLLARTLDNLLDRYRVVVVDLPTHVLDAYHQYLVERSDQVLLVASLDIPSLYRSRQYLELAKQHLDTTGNGKLKLVLNRYDLQGAYGMPNKKLEEEFHTPIYARLPNNWELNVEANSLGCVLSKVNPKSDLVKALRQLAAKLTGHPSSGQMDAQKPPGFMARWLSRNSRTQSSSKTAEPLLVMGAVSSHPQEFVPVIEMLEN